MPRLERQASCLPECKARTTRRKGRSGNSHGSTPLEVAAEQAGCLPLQSGLASGTLALGEACNYDVIMKAQIIQIGNSQGIRIPKMMLEETRLSGEVELEVHPDGLLIRSSQKPRGNWDAEFKALADADDDLPIQPEPATGFESKEWKW